MPWAAKKPCRRFNCAVLTDGSYCPKHKRERKRVVDKGRPSARKRGYTSIWEKARKVFLEENPLCKIDLDHGRTVAANVVDHVIPHRGDQNIFWDQSNWQALCTTCHNRKTATEAGPIY